MCTIEAAMMGAGAVASFAGQQQMASDANAASYANAVRAREATVRGYNDEQKRYAFDAKAQGNEGFKAAMQGREALATARASASDAGLDFGFSVDDILSGVQQKTANNLATVQDKFDDMRESYKSRVDTLEAQGNARIASMPTVRSPSPLALAINLGTAGARGYSGNSGLSADKFWTFGQK